MERTRALLTRLSWGTSLSGRLVVGLPMLYYKTYYALRRAMPPDHKNIIYFYGPLFFDSVVPLELGKEARI